MQPNICPRCGADLTIDVNGFRAKLSCQACHCYERIETAMFEHEKAALNERYHQLKAEAPTGPV